MPRHLTEADITMLAKTINTLQEPSWNAVVKLARRRLGHSYSRQALSKYAQIKTALEARKEHLRRARPRKKRTSETDTEAILLARIDALDAELARINAENEALMSQFAIWAYNTHVLGIPDHRLDAPLQPINRGYSEGNT